MVSICGGSATVVETSKLSKMATIVAERQEENFKQKNNPCPPPQKQPPQPIPPHSNNMTNLTCLGPTESLVEISVPTFVVVESSGKQETEGEKLDNRIGESVREGGKRRGRKMEEGGKE